MIVIEVSNSNKDMTRAITPKITKTSLIQTERTNPAAAETLTPKATNRGDPVSMTNIVAKVIDTIGVDKVKIVAVMIKVIVIKELKEGVNTHVVIGLKTHKGLHVINNNTINNSSNISNSINNSHNNTMVDGVQKANNVPQVIVILVNGVTALTMSLNEITIRRP